MERIKRLHRVINIHSRFVSAILQRLADGDFVMTKDLFKQLMGMAME